MKFGIIASVEIARAKELAKQITEFLVIKGHKVLSEDKLKGADIVITLGGDGTLLHAGCQHLELNVSFLGINVGTLGFLTAVEADNWQSALEQVIEGNYFVSERITIEAKVGSKDFRSLNEIVVKGMYRVIELAIKVNGERFLGIVGDGVIVATQTGATAYSLSAGGPIVDPEVDSLLITPINAHGLPIPSVVVSPDDVIEIEVKKADDALVVVDGRDHEKLSEGDVIKVFRGKHKVKFAYLDKHQFLKSLNSKFGLADRFSK